MDYKNLKTVTVPEGVVRRQYEQTASRDHNVTLVAGTYDLKPIKTPEGRVSAYWAFIPAIAHKHSASTIEVCGVAYGWETRGGEGEMYSLHVYAYEYDVENKAKHTGMVFQ